MKKQNKVPNGNDEPMKAEYDFSEGVRGKHYHALKAGYTITVHHKDGTIEVKEIKAIEDAVTLDPDVRAYFPDSESVNEALRSLIRLISAGRKEEAN